jgi:putative salt-induced outer membrane protein
MRRLTTIISLTALVAAVAGPAMSAPAPRAVRAMIVKAAQSDDPTVFASVIAIAKQAHPRSSAEIDALAKTVADREARRRLALAAPDGPAPSKPKRAAPPPAPVTWKATAELGGSSATGKKDVVALYGSLDVSRIGPVWTHRLTAREDFQRTDGSTTTDRFAAAYEPRAQIATGTYAYGLTQYEHDRTLGYRNRYTVGAGVGMKVVDQPNLSIGGDLGPALRFTDYYVMEREQSLAGRASLSVRWLPTDRVTVAQEGAVYVEAEQSSARSVTSVETLLFGPLKARLSYNMQYERDSRPSRVARSDRDTITRASLLYSF